jgi:DnaJ homolog subfamily C member 19
MGARLARNTSVLARKGRQGWPERSTGGGERKEHNKMSALHVAAIAAGAAQHSSHGDDTSGMYLAVAFGLYFGTAGLGWALGAIRNYLPHGKWRSRVHLATLLMYYPHTIYMDDKNLNRSIRIQVHNLFRCKKYVGWTFVYMNPDETYFQVKVDKTWWDTGRILGSFGNGGVVDIGNLLLNGQHRLEKSGVWFVTNERWVTVQENMRAEARRKAEGNLSPDVLTALAILGLSSESPATLDTINAARNKLLKTAHPDRGGSTEMAQLINNAHDLLSRYVVA